MSTVACMSAWFAAATATTLVAQIRRTEVTPPTSPTSRATANTAHMHPTDTRRSSTHNRHRASPTVLTDYGQKQSAPANSALQSRQYIALSVIIIGLFCYCTKYSSTAVANHDLIRLPTIIRTISARYRNISENRKSCFGNTLEHRGTRLSEPHRSRTGAARDDVGYHIMPYMRPTHTKVPGRNVRLRLNRARRRAARLGENRHSWTFERFKF